MLKNIALSSLGLVFIFTACNNHKKQQEDLQKEVIIIHDSVMADMGMLMEKKMHLNKIMKRLDSLKSLNMDLDTAQLKSELAQTIEQLGSADEAMMTWMHNFDPEYTGKSHEDIMDYLNNQKVKINSVDSTIKNIILKSDSIIAKYK